MTVTATQEWTLSPRAWDQLEELGVSLAELYRLVRNPETFQPTSDGARRILGHGLYVIARGHNIETVAIDGASAENWSDWARERAEFGDGADAEDFLKNDSTLHTRSVTPKAPDPQRIAKRKQRERDALMKRLERGLNKKTAAAVPRIPGLPEDYVPAVKPTPVPSSVPKPSPGLFSVPTPASVPAQRRTPRDPIISFTSYAFPCAHSASQTDEVPESATDTDPSTVPSAVTVAPAVESDTDPNTFVDPLDGVHPALRELVMSECQGDITRLVVCSPTRVVILSDELSDDCDDDEDTLF